jgi:hypothetical protein
MWTRCVARPFRVSSHRSFLAIAYLDGRISTHTFAFVAKSFLIIAGIHLGMDFADLFTGILTPADATAGV